MALIISSLHTPPCGKHAGSDLEFQSGLHPRNPDERDLETRSFAGSKSEGGDCEGVLHEGRVVVRFVHCCLVHSRCTRNLRY